MPLCLSFHLPGGGFLWNGKPENGSWSQNGKSVTINGNGVYLANASGGALPAGGYGVTVVDRALWEQVKAELGQAYGPWFASGRIKEKKSEAQGLNFAIDHADEKTGDDPMPQKNLTKE